MLSRPTADKQSVGTVYWAVLVKGDFITTDNWIASPYDFNAAFDQVSANLNEFKQTYVTESTALAKKTQNLESTINDPVNGLAAQAKQISDRMTKSDVDSAISTATEALKTSIGGKSFDNIVIGVMSKK